MKSKGRIMFFPIWVARNRCGPVDNFVVKKLLSKYESYIKNKRFDKDLFLTLRVPNPDCEKAEAKILLSVFCSFNAGEVLLGRVWNPSVHTPFPPRLRVDWGQKN